jgi:hypothetical protein
MCCNGFNGRDLDASEKHPSSNYIVCGDQSSEGSTVFRIVDAAIVVDLHGLGKDARLDIHRLLALDVGDIGREESDATVAGLPLVCAAIYWAVASWRNARVQSAETVAASATPT